MSDRFTMILRECSEEHRSQVAQFLGKAFSLKEATCAAIAGSAPIALLSDLGSDEAASLMLIMGGLNRPGVVVEFSSQVADDLPKIDWPRRPTVYKREIADYASDLTIAVDCPDCGKTHALLDLLRQRFHGGSGAAPIPELATVDLVPEMDASRPDRKPATKGEFKGSSMPEITPFFNQTLPENPPTKAAKGKGPATKPMAPAAPETSGSQDAVARLNELFPDDDASGFIPDNNDITNILNRLLPDEDSDSASAAVPRSQASSAINLSMPTSGFSVFLAKIGDEARRTKAVPLIAELGKLSTAEADALSKKVIIPVLKGVSKDDAEAAKQRFAKIGILARVKGAETAS